MTVTKVCNNYVLVKFDRPKGDIIENTITRPSGIIVGEFVVDRAQHKVTGEGAWALIRGEVIDYAKDEQFYYREDIEGLGDAGQLDYDTDCEIEKGDTIIFDYHAGLEAKEKGRMWFEGQDIYGFVRYSHIFCRIRSGEVTPVNGYVLIEPFKKTERFFDYEKEVVSETKGIVRYAGSPVRKFRYNIYTPISNRDSQCAPVINKNTDGILGQRLAQVGDIVLFKYHNSRDLEYEAQRQLPHYYVLQHRDIEAIQGDVEIELIR